MAVNLDATVGSPTANAYCDLAEADAYHETHMYAEPWFAMLPTRRKVALIHATRLLDEQVRWHGTKVSSQQALQMPRYGMPEKGNGSGSYYYDLSYGFTVDPATIPVWLKNATAELARHLELGDRTLEPDLLEYKAVTIGSLSVIKDDTKRKDVLPESVQAMVRPYGVVTSANGIGFVKLMRA